MIDRISWFFVERAYAADARIFFGLFDPFAAKTGDNAKDTFILLFGKITYWVIAIAVAVAFIYLIVSGIQYITAGGDAEKATKARTGILNAIIGIVVIALAWVILSFAAGLGKNLGGV